VNDPRICHKSQFLTAKFGTIMDLEVLSGGHWSSAYSFSVGDRALVARFGVDREWFEADRAAMAFSSRRLPVPDVLDIGDAFGGAYAISQRRFGRRLEDVEPEQSEVAGPMLASLIGALFAAPRHRDLQVTWHGSGSNPGVSWRDWLRQRLDDDPNPHLDETNSQLSAHQDVTTVFQTCTSRILNLVERCPERRDLVHGDLLHANVLVTEDARHPTAIFSWKCSVRGDFLYDVAWCSFWSPWHRGIAAADPWGSCQRESQLRSDDEAWVDATIRHHCYELHIGATHLGWFAGIGDLENLQRVVRHLEFILDRGPFAITS
jgi:hypothetical protein